ncbi:cytochrome P450 2K6-like [Heterodontus francisci]|uniref:cytochrome P450 2K6-like n=1 Tax=Heterodontus francisci TaxID=7792 RepID=UPI00355C8F95
MNLLNIFPLSSSSILLLIILVFLIIFFINGSSTRSSFNAPPSPTPLPLIGNLHQLDLKNFYKSLVKLADKYGSIYTLHLGLQKCVVLADYKSMKNALADQGDIFCVRYATASDQSVSAKLGMTLSEGEMWKQLRRFTLSTFRDLGLGKNSFEEKIIEEAEFLVNVFKSYNCQPFLPNEHLGVAASNLIAMMLFQQRFEHEDEIFKRFFKVLEKYNEINATEMIQILNAFPFLKHLPGNHKEFIELHNEMNTLIQPLIAKILEQLTEGDVRNYVEAFLVKQKEEAGNPGSYFHDKNLSRLILEMFAGGTETTAVNLQWSLLLMVKYPEIQKRVQEEIDQEIGTERAPRMEDRKKLPYTNAVIHEAVRFANVIPIIQRSNIGDTYLGGYFIPKRTWVMTLLWSVLRDKTQWEKPDEFNPSHFLNSEGRFVKRDAFLPFGAGRRICPGQSIAMMELFLFFTTLLQKFKLQAPAHVTDLDITHGTGRILAPKPYKLCAVPRQ